MEGCDMDGIHIAEVDANDLYAGDVIEAAGADYVVVAIERSQYRNGVANVFYQWLGCEDEAHRDYFASAVTLNYVTAPRWFGPIHALGVRVLAASGQ